MADPSILPRVIRLRDAPRYLGMDRDRFNEDVRPFLIEVRIGIQGVAFDRLDLDAWFDDYKARNGQPGKRIKLKGEDKWGKPTSLPGSLSVGRCGTSKRKSDKAEGFDAVVERLISKKQ